MMDPQKIQSYCKTLMPWMFGVAGILGAIGLVWGLIISPPDYQQGETVRIMYIHVPASWGALATYTVMMIFSVMALIKKTPLFYWMTHAAAPIGFALCLISLITGSIWGYPTWGTWWVWDARLTSMLLLAFLYAGYLLVTNTIENRQQALHAGGYIAIIGWINIPIIKWSVTWWHTLHQPAGIIRFAKPAVHWSMLCPLMIMAFALAAFCIGLFMVRLQTTFLKLHHQATLLRGQS